MLVHVACAISRTVFLSGYHLPCGNIRRGMTPLMAHSQTQQIQIQHTQIQGYATRARTHTQIRGYTTRPIPIVAKRTETETKREREAQDKESQQQLPIPNIPKHRLELKFTRSSGPGGQNVNKLNTQVEIRFKPADADWMGEELRDRFLELHTSRLNKLGEMFIVSSTQRKQEANMRECLHKLELLMEEASWIPKERIITKPPEWTKEKRLEEKKRRSRLKETRQLARVARNWDF